MKVHGRMKNSFNGSYYGYHDEMEAKSAPLYFKLLFILTILVFPIGIVIAFYRIIQGDVGGFFTSVLLVIVVAFPLIHLDMVMFDIAKYGKARPQAKLIGSAFTGISALILACMVLSRFTNFFYVMTAGILMIFLSIGVGLYIGGKSKIEREQKNCTTQVWAICADFETLNPHIPILNEQDATYKQNEVIARTEVARPICEFEYNGTTYHATPEQYSGKLKLIKGNQYKVYINPQNPQEIYCEDNSNSKFLMRMGIIWSGFTAFMAVIMFLILGLVF